MKATTTLDFADLMPAVNQLEAHIYDHRYQGRDHWLRNQLDDHQLQIFLTKLYRLAQECLCMHHLINAPESEPYVSNYDDVVTAPVLIKTTRQLIYCCDLNLIYEYRQPTSCEYETIRFLEVIHAELIGDCYFQHPYMIVAESDEFL